MRCACGATHAFLCANAHKNANYDIRGFAANAIIFSHNTKKKHKTKNNLNFFWQIQPNNEPAQAPALFQASRDAISSFSFFIGESSLFYYIEYIYQKSS